MDWREILRNAMANPVVPPLDAGAYAQSTMPNVPFRSPPMMGRFSQLAYGMSGVPTGVGEPSTTPPALQPPLPPGLRIPTPIGPSRMPQGGLMMADPTDIIRRFGGRSPFSGRIQ